MRRTVQIETYELCEGAGAVAPRLDARDRTPADRKSDKPRQRDFISDPTILHADDGSPRADWIFERT